MNRLSLSSLLLGLLALGASAQPTNELPDFGNPADAIISKNREVQIGRSTILQLHNAGVLVQDAELNEYVRGLGARLVGHANDGDHQFHFFVVDDASINAFALPGGFIGVNTGLIEATQTESELASVLAHEISHVTQRHIARSIYDNQRSSVVSMATMLAAIVLGAATDLPGDAMQGVIAASQAAMIQRQINFTRSNEYEADRIGMEVLASAGFDPQGMPSFFEKLGRRYGSAAQQIPALLRTHPVTTDRVAESRARARQLPAVEAVDSTNYALSKIRVQLMRTRTAEESLAFFAAEADDNPANRYGKALSLMELSRTDEAERLLHDLATEYPGVISYRIGYAEALLRSGSSAAALQVYSDANALFPRNVPLTVHYAEALIATGNAAASHRLLLDLLNNVPPSPDQIRLIARAANAEGDIGNAYYYMSEYHLSLGDLPLALQQLSLALESPGVNAVDHARFQARLEQLRKYLPDERQSRREDLADRLNSAAARALASAPAAR
jgi:predicted Zn-dependent protease